MLMMICLLKNYSSPITKINLRGLCTTVEKNIIVDENENVGVLTLNKPKKLNATDMEMINTLSTTLRKWENTKSVVIIKGTGKAFSAGGDIKAMLDQPRQYTTKMTREEYTLNHIIGHYKIPYIALMDGITMGSGAGLSVHGKYRVATDKTLFAMPETAIGLCPDVGSSYFLPRLDGKLGLYLGLTGSRLRGRDVQKSGLATHFCSSSTIPDLEQKLLTCKSVSDIDSVLNKMCPHDNNVDFSLAKNMKQLNNSFSANSVEDIISNLKADGSNWAQETLETLHKMCPTSLKVTLRLMEIGSTLNLAQCLQIEFRLIVRLWADKDFSEGVRAVLIDKDNKPKWNPSKLEDVTEERVQTFFDHVGDEELKI